MSRTDVVKVKLNEIQFRKDLYPRFEPNHQVIQKYSEAIEYLPPIKVNQNNILIDGFHRWKAHLLAKVETIRVEIVETENEQKLKILAYKLNSIHGMQLSIEEKKKFAREMYGLMSEQEIADTISVGKSSIYDWTTTQRENAKVELERKVIELYLRAWNTQESIAEELLGDGKKQSSISDIMKNIENSIAGKIDKSWNLKKDDPGYSKEKPFLFNIWNLQKAEKETSHFGHFPQIFMDNLLYYHTEPLDIIYDPFAGDGTTIDSCKDMLRRYYCSDKEVKPGREEDIKQWRIQDGLPKNLPKPALLFLDPPYWKLAKDEYSKDDDDLGNMPFEKFKEEINKFVKLLIARKVKRIAYLIRPIYDDGFNWVDPIFELHEILKDKYRIEGRCVIPYSTEQYNGNQVEIMKKEKKCMSIIRDLVIWNNGL